MKEFTVSLDIDETLIHSTEYRVNEAQVALGPFWTTPRPGLNEFLVELNSFANIGFFTHASRAYAERVLALFAPFVEPKFLLARENCTRTWNANPYNSTEGHLKDLKKAVKHRSELNRLIAVDDLPWIYPRQYSNVVGVTEFKGDPNDNLLPRLLEYLRHLSTLDNVRTVEKRFWLKNH